MITSVPRPQIVVVLAISADGKIATSDRAPAKFSSPTDFAHLERQIARADATLFGAGTLRAHQTTVSVRSPQLLELVGFGRFFLASGHDAVLVVFPTISSIIAYTKNPTLSSICLVAKGIWL